MVPEMGANPEVLDSVLAGSPIADVLTPKKDVLTFMVIDFAIKLQGGLP